MHAGGNVRPDIAHDGGLHRADVGDDRAGRQRWADLGGNCSARTDRRAQNDQIGALDGFGRCAESCVDEAELQRFFARLSRARMTRDAPRKTLAPHRMTDRGADQADADQGHLLKLGRAHAALPFVPMKSVNAATTVLFSASVPMVRRSVCPSP